MLRHKVFVAGGVALNGFALILFAGLIIAGILIKVEEPEFADQAKAIAKHGPAMRAILRKDPSQRMIVHYESGSIPDVPHDLVYDASDVGVSVVLREFQKPLSNWSSQL